MQDAAALFGALDRELWIVTAASGDRRGGLVATAVSPASLSPETPRVLVGLAKQHRTTELVSASGTFALHLIDEDHLPWVSRFGFESGRDHDKLAGLRVTTAATGSPILEECVGWLDCRVEDRLDTGDRIVYLAEVLQAQWRNGRPLTLKRFLALAPAEQLQRLRGLVERDRLLEAEAIGLWRRQRGSVRGATP